MGQYLFSSLFLLGIIFSLQVGLLEEHRVCVVEHKEVMLEKTNMN